MTGHGVPRVDLDRALADQLVKERGLPFLAHVVVLGLVMVLVGDALPRAVLVPWGAAVIVIAATRAVWWERARALGSPPGTIRRIARITMVCLGLAWGVGTAVAAQTLPIGTVAILLVALAGLLSAGHATLIGDRWVFPLYAAATVIPVLIGVLVADQSRLENVVAMLIVVFLGFTVRLHRRTHELFRERLQTESDLSNRERQLAEAQALAHVGSWEWDIPGNAVTWTDELYRIYAVAPDQPAGYEPFLAVLHPDDRSRVRELIERQFGDHHPLEYESRVRRANGEVRHTFNRQIMVTDSQGQPVRMMGTALDITARKIQEEALRAALREVKTLRGMLRICGNCKRVHTENGGWESLDSYVRDHTHAQFSHGLCPDCAGTWSVS